MTNAELARVLERIARLLEVKGEIRFKIQAHEKAAQVLASLDRPASELFAEGGTKALMALPGVGPGIAAKLAELLTKGRSTEYEKLKASLPKGLEELLDVPGLGPKTALLIATKLKVKGIADLEQALASGKVATLPRLGAKAAERIAKGIALMKSSGGRKPVSEAMQLAEALRKKLVALPGVRRVEIAGSLRRRRETVGDLDLLATVAKPADAPAVLKAFVAFPEAATVIAVGDTKASVRLSAGLDADLRVVESAAFGAALHYFTGSKAHNIRIRELGVKRGLSINEYGVNRKGRRIAGATEEEVFKAVGLPWIPPELREDTGEVEAAKTGRLPRLLEPGDIKGDLHLHTTWSDGAHTAAEMAAAARALGYEWLALCDHSRSLAVAGGLTIPDLAKKNKEIDRLNRGFKGFRLLKGAEVDILADGTLDYPDEVLAELDVVVVSVHTRFNLPKDEQTRRIVKALTNRHVTLLAHPTGRYIGRRPPYEFDLGDVIKAAKDHGKALELNTQMSRLDLPEAELARARAAGIAIAVDSDAHRADQLAAVKAWGVGLARRAWLTPAQVLNTLPLPRLLKHLQR